ncbi:Leucine-rich melanocyte differentiation-associated protein [Lamellibrachia satsuma]|nr:Leucine-rich melanocyte differentiation-associated protein [Lamellibrachia satsuma]
MNVEITDLERFLDSLSKQLPSLKYLSILGNPACPDQLSCTDTSDEDYEQYRIFVIYNLPKLKFLDSTPVKTTERTEAQRRGCFLRVARPPSDHEKERGCRDDDDDNPNPYTPLPKDINVEPKHKATFGQCRYVYYGRHSEGNRFIRNNDL